MFLVQRANGAIPQTINVAPTDHAPQPGVASRDNHTRAHRSVRFRVPDRKIKTVERQPDREKSPHNDNHAESFVSSLPSTVPETMDEDMIDGNVDAVQIQAETEDREAHVRDTQYSNATQPISQGAYEEVIRSRSEQRSPYSEVEPDNARVKGAQWHEEEEEDVENSLQEGDSNFVDICSSYAAAHEPLDSGPINISPTQTQHEFTQFRESQRFKTPATAGKKRDHAGQLIETPFESRNPFARTGNATPGNVVGLSQAFANTQAASSPLPVQPTSELRSDKPSPGLTVERNVKSLPTSSPTRMLSDVWRPSEPSAQYVPVRHSQALRKSLGSEADAVGHTQQSTLDDFDSIPSTVERKKRARERERQARKQMEAASSPNTSPGRRGGIPNVKPPIRAASERPASATRSRSKSRSRSLPSSPPAVETEDAEEEMVDIRIDNEVSSLRAAGTAPEKAPQPETSSAITRSNKSVTTLVPNTTRRTTRSTTQPSRYVQPSPSERRMRHEVFLEPISSNHVRVANSQRSLPFTQEEAPLIAISSAGSIDVIPASPEGPLQSTEPSALRGQSLHEDQTREEVDPTAEDDHRSIEDGDRLGSGNTEKHGVVEPSSDILLQEKQKPSTYATAPTDQGRDTSTTTAEWSSQPVRTTPPGRKRKRLGEISQEDPGPAASQSSAFDPEVGLSIDHNFHSTGVRTTAVPDASRLVKRSRLQFPVANEDVAHKDSLNTTAERAIPRRQLRNRNVVEDDDEQNAENAAPSSSLSELPVTPSLVKTPVKKSSTRKSIWSPTASPHRRNQSATSRSESQAARAGLQEIVTGQTRRVVSKSTLKTPRPTLNSLPPIGKSSPDPIAVSTVQPTAGTPAPPGNEVTAPEMIFAYYMDTTRAYYPAICQGYSTNEEKYITVWPGYDAEHMSLHSICSLDLRIGDEVRVDRKGWPKTVWRIRDFGPIEPAEAGERPLRDIYGHTSYFLEPKKSATDLRKCIGKNEPVAIASIYLDLNQFNRLKKRPFRYGTTTAGQDPAKTSRASTPPVRISTPSTPSSRSRNSAKDPSVQPAIRQGIFSNMVFAVSTAVEEAHPETAEIVRNHGGIILKSNFQELVTEDMELRPNFQHLKFAALLAERHLKSEKYLQALALGLPCLSWRWVEASVKRGRPAHWQDYLLPAGESTELDGAVRSRVMPPIDIATTSLSQIIQKRPQFFTNSNAVFITGRGKTEIQRKTYLFFIRVMGLTQVERMVDLAAANQHLQNVEKKSTTWLVVDDKEYQAAIDMVKTIRDASFGKTKKKKVDSVGDWEYRVVDKKFLVQSLILGRLCEDGNFI